MVTYCIDTSALIAAWQAISCERRAVNKADVGRVAIEHRSSSCSLHAQLRRRGIDKGSAQPCKPLSIVTADRAPMRCKEFSVVEPDTDRRWCVALPPKIGQHCAMLLQGVAPVIHAISEVPDRSARCPRCDQSFRALNIIDLCGSSHPIEIGMVVR